jgi:homoserine O-acetyltransferase
MMESIVVICGNAKQYPFGIVRLQGSIDALKADTAFNGGNYTSPPVKGLRAIAMHYRGWAISPAALERDAFDGMGDKKREETLKSYSDVFLGFDANNLVSQAETWKRHNVADSPGFGGKLEPALRSIKAKVLLMPSTTDQYFPLADAVYESKMIADATVTPIESVQGHTAGGGADPAAAKFIDQTLKQFLK